MELRCLTDDATLVRAVQKLNLGILPVQPPVFCYRRAAKDTHCLSWAAMISGGGAICGAVIADLELERSGHRTVQLRTLAVLTQFRRQGIGKKLVLKVIQQAKKAEEDTGEIDAVRLHVHTENDGALAFYKALGFVEKDRVEDYYRHLEPRTAFVMEYSLH
ncbi:hypothetical protein KXD40_008566 [Peronospora effusa]|uniref:N-acetyltransferase domain-containing protein n=1 Tax=Peronospora effusa TaxID=542832 RepID=A0A3M6VS38_9STRA|nr:hypothetical protein DD238_002291 [Peronospora effusa]RQM17817.1 hypothetical protein DD237_001646 [Peronospora effusa]UIZ24570.1 hypothetical protein KXD40_008566 [Peronospora effusa]CAI5729243.1 unnamed protein product [Peronospora effusa]